MRLPLFTNVRMPLQHSIGFSLFPNLHSPFFHDLFQHVFPNRTHDIKLGSTNADYISLKGWVQSIRVHKSVAFMQLHDGNDSIQIVIDDPNLAKTIHTGSSVEVSAYQRPSLSDFDKNTLEFHANDIRVIGPSPPQKYPLQKKSHSPEFLRTIPHLRIRGSKLHQMLVARSLLQKSFSEFFQKKEFHYLHPPLSTTSDCEGGSAVFQILPKLYGEKNVFLSVSSQLHLEAAAIGSLGNVWTLSPVFRAEPSDTNRHLSEFWMVEAETCFITSVDSLIELVQKSLHRAAKCLLESKIVTSTEELKSHLRRIETGSFCTISYIEAIDILSTLDSKERNIINSNGKTMSADIESYSIKWGDSLTFDQEQKLLNYVIKSSPNSIIGLFIKEYPENGKPFYMKRNSNVVCNFDLIVEGVGELAGGSIREDSLDKLEKTINALELQKECLEWYIDTRRYGSVPHGGFGIGFDRVVQWLLCIKNVRDAIYMPRVAGSIFGLISMVQTSELGIKSKLFQYLNSTLAYQRKGIRPYFYFATFVGITGYAIHYSHIKHDRDEREKARKEGRSVPLI